MKIRTSNKAGFTLVEIMIVVAIIGLLAAIAIPNFVRARQTSQVNACVNNLRQIDGAMQQFALENGKKTDDPVTTDDIMVYVGRKGDGTDVYCPLSGASAGAFAGYKASVTKVGTTPSCANTDATAHNVVFP